MSTDKNGLRVAVYPAAFTLLGVFITATIGWISTAQIASINYRQSCVARIDAKESLVRSKAEAFFSAQGGIVSIAAHKTQEEAAVEKLIDEATRAGYALSSYFDGRLAITTQLLALSIGTRLDAKTPMPTEKETEDYKKLMTEWESLYREFFSSIGEARKDC